MPSSRGSPDSGIEHVSPTLAGGFFPTSATWEALANRWHSVNVSFCCHCSWGCFIILNLEGSQTAPGPTGDTLEVVKPSLFPNHMLW